MSRTGLIALLGGPAAVVWLILHFTSMDQPAPPAARVAAARALPAARPAQLVRPPVVAAAFAVEPEPDPEAAAATPAPRESEAQTAADAHARLMASMTARIERDPRVSRYLRAVDELHVAPDVEQKVLILLYGKIARPTSADPNAAPPRETPDERARNFQELIPQLATILGSQQVARIAPEIWVRVEPDRY